MKKQQKNSAGTFALRIALGLALTSLSAILLASSFRPPAAGPQPDRPAPDVMAMLGPVSQEQAGSTMSQVLPDLINQLTPQGQVTPESNDSIAEGLEALSRSLGR